MAVTNRQRTDIAANYSTAIWGMLILVFAAEAYTWARMSDDELTQAILIGFAIGLVYIRRMLIATEIIALEIGDHGLANSARIVNGLTLVITMFSMTSFFTDVFNDYRVKSIVSSAGVTASSSNLDAAKNQMARIAGVPVNELSKVGAGGKFSESELSENVSKYSSIQAQIDAERERLNAANESKMIVYNKQVAEFWNAQYNAEFTRGQITDQSCTPKTTSYGLMKSAAKAVCDDWNRIKQSKPAETTSPLIAQLQAELGKYSMYHQYAQQLNAAEQAVVIAQREYDQSVIKSGSAGGDVYMPAIHRIGELVGTSPERVSTLLAMTASFAILWALHVMYKGQLRFLRDDDGTIIDEVADNEASILPGAAKRFFSRQIEKARDKLASIGDDDGDNDPVPPRPTTRKEPAKEQPSAQGSVFGGGFSATSSPVVASAGVTAYGGSHDAVVQYPVQGATAVAVSFGDVEPVQQKADVIDFLSRASQRDFAMPAGVVESAHETASVSDEIAKLSQSWDEVTGKGFGHPGLDENGRVIENCNDWTCKFRYRMVVLGEKASTAQEAFKCNDGHISRYGTKKIQPEIDSGMWANFKLEGAANA